MTAKKNYRNVEDHIPVFAISIAAELSGLHPQTLRQYDKLGIVSPSRQGGSRRLYSRIDIAKLKYVAQLTSEGVNLEGVKRILRDFHNSTSVVFPGRITPTKRASKDLM